MDPIVSFSGIASGIQWRDMVDQIMRLEASRRLSPVQADISAQRNRREAWNSFNGLLGKLSAAAHPLRDGSAFGGFRATVSTPSSGKSLLTASVNSSAAAGSYNVEVLELARAEKLSGGAFSGVSTALGVAGEIFLNGKRVELGAGDSLTAVRDRINAANSGTSPSGVTATILSTSPAEHRLVLTSDQTGARGIELVDGSGGALRDLGLVTGATVENAGPSGRPQTQRFTSTTSSLAGMLGITAPPETTTIEIGGRKVTVDLLNDTLLTLMNRVASQGGEASIAEEIVGGRTMYRLDVGGPVVADVDADDPDVSQRVAELLGFRSGVRTNEITAGADARVRVDGFEISRRRNTISDALAGVTLNLQQAEPGTALDLRVTRDTEAGVGAIQHFASAYNEVLGFVEKNREPGAALYGNGALRSMMSSLRNVLLGGVEGLAASNPYTHSAIAGVSLTRTGTLEVDIERLRNAITTNPGDIRALFGTQGSTSDPDLSFVQAGPKTRGGVFDVVITAPATRGSQSGAAWPDPAAYAATDGVADTLTIRDSVSGLTRDFTIGNGSKLDDLVQQMNSDFASQQMRLSASRVGDALVIDSTEYGGAGRVTLLGSALPALGLSAGAFAGTDVQGTIGGHAATGRGQVLTGAPGGGADGLAVRYAGASARSAGEVRHVLGVGSAMQGVADTLSRAGDGVVRGQIGAIERSVESLSRRADDIQARLDQRRAGMIEQFARMESAMSRLQTQSGWLQSQIQAMQPRRDW
jgi:flagellar hook-associated protein 2